jgi:hypothetical protein
MKNLFLQIIDLQYNLKLIISILNDILLELRNTDKYNNILDRLKDIR